MVFLLFFFEDSMYSSKTAYLYQPEIIAGFHVNNFSLAHRDHLV